jgi:hypothetical protein
MCGIVDAMQGHYSTCIYQFYRSHFAYNIQIKRHQNKLVDIWTPNSRLAGDCGGRNGQVLVDILEL